MLTTICHVGLTNTEYAKQPNAGLQLRRAISTQAEGIGLLEKHAIAPSAASDCSVAPLPKNTAQKCETLQKK